MEFDVDGWGLFVGLAILIIAYRLHVLTGEVRKLRKRLELSEKGSRADDIE